MNWKIGRNNTLIITYSTINRERCFPYFSFISKGKERKHLVLKHYLCGMTTNRHICFTAVMLVFLLSLYACQLSENRTEAWAFSNDDGHTWGLIRTDGTVLVPTDAFSQRPSSVVGGMFSLPDGKGRLHLHAANNPARAVTPRSFARIGHYFADVTLAQETTDGPILLIDKQGRDIASTAQYTPYAITRMHNFSEGRALFVTAQGKYGYMDTQGRIVVQPVYDIAHDYYEGVW